METIDGSANEGEDYQAVDEILTFEPMETEKEIGITIVDDNQWEPDEEFFLKLSLLSSGPTKDVKLGRTSIMEIQTRSVGRTLLERSRLVRKLVRDGIIDLA